MLYSWLLLFSHGVLFDSSRHDRLARLAPLSSIISQSLLRFMSIESVMLSNHLILCHPLLCLQSFPASKSWLFASDGQSIETSASASILPVNIQGWFPLDWLLRSPCCPRDSQESFPAPQFESISCLTHGLLYGPTLTSINDYWKSHSFDYMDLCWQSDVNFQV